MMSEILFRLHYSLFHDQVNIHTGCCLVQNFEYHFTYTSCFQFELTISCDIIFSSMLQLSSAKNIDCCHQVYSICSVNVPGYL